MNAYAREKTLRQGEHRQTAAAATEQNRFLVETDQLDMLLEFCYSFKSITPFGKSNTNCVHTHFGIAHKCHKTFETFIYPKTLFASTKPKHLSNANKTPPATEFHHLHISFEVFNYILYIINIHIMYFELV